MQDNLKLICFDLNKTLIKENTWLELNKAMGMTVEEDQAMFDLYSAGKLTYMDWQKELERIYIERGQATKENILKIINQYTFVPGAMEVVDYLKTKGYLVSLISGSIDLLVEKVAKELNIDYFSANNSFSFDSNGYLSTIDCLGEDTQVKVLQLQEQCKNLNINVIDAACIGDGDNDLEIFKLSGHGITFTGSKIEKDAWKIVGSLEDLKNIL